MPLFERVSYHISPSLEDDLRREIAQILDANGATEVGLERATHVVSNTIEFEGCDALTKGIACVSPRWVERSMELGQLQDPKYFSADKEKIFSGIVATSADIPSGDKEVIAAGIIEFGGAWRDGLTRDVTHLFVTNTRSAKYQTAMHFRDTAHITILLPQWFDQCCSTQTRLPPDVFAFPDPAYMNREHDEAAYKAQIPDKKLAGEATDKAAVFRGMQAEGLSSPALASAPPRNIWQGRTILLSSSLALDTLGRNSVEGRIARTGGQVVVAQDEDEIEALGRADVLVTRFRAGPAYAKALADGKTIGTLTWLFHVERVGFVSRPRDHLLHYPVQSRPIDGFADHEITVTNYQGDQREYIKKLIAIMGAKFTPTMSGRNTIVIAAYKGGAKTTKADQWSVPVVTHKWLEDCFVEWRNLTPAQKRYLDYAPGVNYGTVIGERGVRRVGLEEDPELPPINTNGKEALRRVAAVVQEAHGKNKKPMSKEEDAADFMATGTSAREAREAAEVEDALDLGGDPGEDPEEAAGAPMFTPIKVGPPRGVKKTPGKKNPAVTTAAVAEHKVRPKPKPMSSRAVVEDEQEGHGNATLPQKAKPAPKKAVPVPEESGESGDEPSAKAQAKSTPRSYVDNKENDVAGSSAKATGTAKPKPKPRPVMSKKTVPHPEGEGESSDKEQPAKPNATSKSRTEEKDLKEGGSNTIKVTPKPKPGTKRIFSNKAMPPSDSGEGSADDEPEPHGVPKGKGKPRIAQFSHGEGKDNSNAPKSKSKPKPKLPVKSKPRASTPIIIHSDDDGPSGGIKASPRVRPKPSPRTYKPKGKAQAKAAASESEGDDDVQEAPPKKGAATVKTFGAIDKGKSKAPAQQIIPSPNRLVSVDLPDPRSLLDPIRAKPRARLRTPDNTGPGSKHISSPAKASPGKPLPRTTSVRAAAYKAPAPSSERGRPSTRHDTSSRSPSSSLRGSPRRPAPKGRGAAKPIPQKTPSSASSASSPPPPPLQRTPSRRSAAAAATQKLRDEVMPDVINYQNERRRGDKAGSARRRKSSQSKAGNSEDESEDEESEGETRGKKRQKVSRDDGPSGKGKNKAASRQDEDDLEAQPQRFVTHVKKDKRPAPADEDDEPGPSKYAGGSGSRKKVRMAKSESESEAGSDDDAGSTGSKWDPRKIRVLTTKIEVPQAVTDALVKLGIKFTKKPTECTHLVANSFARTEKFLCALSNAPFVLNKDWLAACAEAKGVVGERAYFLTDPDTEHKHRFKLAKALERARELKKNKKKLLDEHFFYFTANVPLDFMLMKNVLQTNGAECVKTAPTMRGLQSPSRHVISCLKDEKIWRPLANQGVPIYTHELVLMAALAQYVDWDGEDKRVPGST